MTRFVSLIVVVLAAFAISGCTAPDSGVRVSAEAPPSPPAKTAAAIPQTRDEPVFYNGKTYRLHFSPAASGGYALAVSGMTAGQAHDAEAVATSSLRYFACKDGVNGKLSDKPRYEGGVWRMTARCA